MGYGALDTVWIGLSLAASFCAYGLVRKFAPIGAVPGLAIETSLLLPLALFGAWWFETYATTPGWNSDLKTNILLICGGAVTAIPLLLFATAARRMRFIALGFVQYIAPSLQFLCGVFLYNEPLTTSRLASFILIWMALVAFSWDALRKL
jgi:chloramphenicol-sensitive protein RarD